LINKANYLKNLNKVKTTNTLKVRAENPNLYLMKLKPTSILLLIGLMSLINSCSNSTTPQVNEPDIPLLDFPKTDEFALKVDDYVSFNLHGFHVLLSLGIIERSEEVSNDALQTLYIDLLKISGLNLNQTIKF
jgi:hypothetical protein